MAAGKIHKSMTALEWNMLVGLAVLWSGLYFFNGVAVRELPTFTVVVGRIAIAAVILQILLRASGKSFNASSSLWAAFFGMGLLNNVIPFTLIVWAQSQIASGLAAILNATTPVFGVLIAHTLTADERLTGGKVVGLLSGIIGVAVLVGGDAFGAIGANSLPDSRSVVCVRRRIRSTLSRNGFVTDGSCRRPGDGIKRDTRPNHALGRSALGISYAQPGCRLVSHWNRSIVDRPGIRALFPNTGDSRRDQP